MKILYNNITKGAFLFLLSLFALSACSNSRNEEPDVHSTVKEGERFTAHIGIESELLSPEALRANSIESIDQVKGLRVLVFDEHQNFLYSEDAVLSSTEPIGGTGRDNDFLPDHTQEGITEIRKFKVSLIKTSKKCYVHFIANHDWEGFQQDYFARGTSAGEFMNHPTLVNNFQELQDGDPGKLALWSVVEVRAEDGGLNEQTFKNKIVKLLRNYAKITLQVDADNVNPQDGDERFQLTGYALVNVPDKGTIAPFETSLYNIKFPYPPTMATEPSSIGYKNKESEVLSDPNSLKFVEVVDPSKETLPYYLFEKDNTKDNNKTFLIIRGIRYNSKVKELISGKVRYYKLDLITTKRIDPSKPDSRGVSTYFHILRNKHYLVNVKGVKSDGYETIKEAMESAAGNNVFADTRLRDFGRVSDGTFSLTVDPIQRIVVTPGKSKFQVFYSGGNEHVKFYPSWSVNPDTSQQGFTEEGYNYTAGEDAYLGGLNVLKDDAGKSVGFEVEVKNIPTDATLYYDVNVAGLRTHNGQPVDGVSGATTPLTRSVRIILHTPFPFHEKLEAHNGDKTLRTLSFRVYEEQIFPKTVFPFDVLIEAPGMTPLNNDPKHKVTIETIYNEERKMYVNYYKITVQDTDRGRLSLDFKLNNAAETGNVRLSSEFYSPALINSNSIPLHRNILQLSDREPKGYRTTITDVADYGTILFDFEGEVLNKGQFSAKYGVSFAPLGRGRFKFDVPESFRTQYGNKPLGIISNVSKNPKRGSISYDFKKTMTVTEWTANGTSANNTTPTPLEQELELSKVDIKGRVYYYYIFGGYWYSKTKLSTPFTFRSYYSDSRQNDLTSEIKILNEQKVADNNLLYYDYELKVSDPDKLRAFTYTGFYFQLWYNKTSQKFLLFSEFESDPVFDIWTP